ncbi:TPR domain protein [Roseobacter sp. SK209-2-6]|uniref:tetratricopeptide repeat protein n=1 Tax=Roseobacter sp. SK209-2-6 TaxID=388739 RepID=UPI0000F3EC00|nr:tetratricopeptide repeat protein [Roseobacter sp. SK209-2-6]EBA16611.1 TPR domain protein [Roseobacter sp. SK209-2-6]
MIANHLNLKAIVAATLATVTISLPFSKPLSAAPVESELLQSLAGADAEEALALNRELQALWRKSGSPAMDLLFSRAQKALEQGEVAAATEHLTALTDHAPDFARGWLLRARALYAAGYYGPAVADLERALALNPNDYDAIFALGQVLETVQRPKRAYQAYLRAKSIHPHHEEVTTALERLMPLYGGRDL